jgi:hypothetical protein
MKLKKLGPKLGLMLGSCVLIFATLEIEARIVQAVTASRKANTVGWAVYDEDLKFRPRPGFDDYSSDGLRDDPTDPVKSRFRVLMLGDSISAYGDNPADTFVGRLEAQLKEDVALADTNVINAAIPGYTNYQEVGYLKKYGLKFAPDLVGIGFCLNDLYEYLHEFKVEDGEIAGEHSFTAKAVNSVDSRAYRLLRRSLFLRWLRRKISIFGSVAELNARDGFTFDYRVDFSNAWKEEPWLRIEQQLTEVTELGKAHEFKVFLVCFRSASSCEKTISNEMQSTYENRSSAWPSSAKRWISPISIYSTPSSGQNTSMVTKSI